MDFPVQGKLLDGDKGYKVELEGIKGKREIDIGHWVWV